MKAATGELTLTVITVIAIGAILAFFWAFWPTIKNRIGGTFNSSTGSTGDNTWSGYVEVVETDLI